MKTLHKRIPAAVLAVVMLLSVLIPMTVPSVSAMDLAEYEQKTYYKIPANAPSTGLKYPNENEKTCPYPEQNIL
jgi:hypothetical protein